MSYRTVISCDEHVASLRKRDREHRTLAGVERHDAAQRPRG